MHAVKSKQQASPGPSVFLSIGGDDRGASSLNSSKRLVVTNK